MSNSLTPALETIILESWSTLDYRADKWGPERIAFDGISNHFREDCGGTAYGIFFLQEGAWVDFRKYDKTKPVEAADFVDNGTGYHYIYTILHHSNKKDRETQTGKFGEGIIMISAGSLRHNIEIYFMSGDWRVSPFVKTVVLDNGQEVHLLCQKVTIGHEKIPGSCTRIIQPSQEILDQINSFSERIIDFREDLPSKELLETHSQHKIFVPEKYFSGELFVKKIKYTPSMKLYLSYQINGKDADSLLTPDRDRVSHIALKIAIKKVVIQLGNIHLLKPLLDPSTDLCLEKLIDIDDNDTVPYLESWSKAFYEQHGSKAVLATERVNINNDAKEQGYTVVQGIQPGLQKILRKAGVQNSESVLHYTPTYELIKPEDCTLQQTFALKIKAEIDQHLFGQPLDADLFLFSRAYEENGKEVTWYSGMTYFPTAENPRSQIYIRATLLTEPEKHLSQSSISQLKSQLVSNGLSEDYLGYAAFAGTYAHEAIHAYSKAIDYTSEFQDGLTDSLGVMLLAGFLKPQ